jgi:gamma-glutamyltranspeptidase/glutathione hydrolase
MNFDPYRYQYPSRRNVVYGSKGMVATSHPLAAQAGLEILKKVGMP